MGLETRTNGTAADAMSVARSTPLALRYIETPTLSTSTTLRESPTSVAGLRFQRRSSRTMTPTRHALRTEPNTRSAKVASFVGHAKLGLAAAVKSKRTTMTTASLSMFAGYVVATMHCTTWSSPSLSAVR